MTSTTKRGKMGKAPYGAAKRAKKQAPGSVAKGAKKQVPPAKKQASSKWVPWAALGLLVATLLCFTTGVPALALSAIKTGNVRALRNRLTGLVGAQPSPLSLTLIHTNDTWGYVLPCG